MYINKNFNIKSIALFSGGHLVWITLWVLSVSLLHHFLHHHWINVPWVPISIVGTAVAFYVGFKNNQSYDRLWEARKIWGAIVNSSRAWGSTVKSYVSNQFAEEKYTKEELDAIKQKLIYRHIAWLYVLRSQLLIPTSWEHENQGNHMNKHVKKIRKRIGFCLVNEEEDVEARVEKLLSTEEYNEVIPFKNTATQIIDKQSQQLAELRETGAIEDFRHMELQKIMNDFYVHQGKCERIKKFPLPRQYGSMSAVFVGIFIFLLPFGMVSEFHNAAADHIGIGAHLGAWLSVPFTIVICWIYIMMELVGDYSENPFEGLGNDIPMLSLCRTIEIDLREMLGETDLPAAIEARNGVLM